MLKIAHQAEFPVAQRVRAPVLSSHVGLLSFLLHGIIIFVSRGGEVTA